MGGARVALTVAAVAPRVFAGFSPLPGVSSPGVTSAGPCALMTRREVADLLRCSTATVDRLAKRGVLSPVRLVPRGRVTYRAADVERLVSR